jgi:hypothetical protein
MNADLLAKAEEAQRLLQSIGQRVCGSCPRNCCHEGTMMGSQDLRRLVRGLRLEPDLAERLRAGLREKAEEIAADVAAARQVLELLRTAHLATPQQLQAAEARVADLAALGELLRGEVALDYEGLAPLLKHTALRANVVRAFRAFRGGEGALARFASRRSSFQFRGRRLAAPRCILHTFSSGCLAGPWKPAKCANFFCTSEPSLLDAVAAHLDFYSFVLANFRVVDRPWIRRVLETEAGAGPAYHEPLVVWGLGREEAQELVELLRKLEVSAQFHGSGEGGGVCAAEVEEWGAALLPGEAQVRYLPRLSASELYELAIGFERLRLADCQRLILVALGELTAGEGAGHPLWTQHTIAQPIGYLECYLVRPEGPVGGEGCARGQTSSNVPHS